eukprot:s4053_g5.t1
MNPHLLLVQMFAMIIHSQRATPSDFQVALPLSIGDVAIPDQSARHIAAQPIKALINHQWRQFLFARLDLGLQTIEAVISACHARWLANFHSTPETLVLRTLEDTALHFRNIKAFLEMAPSTLTEQVEPDFIFWRSFDATTLGRAEFYFPETVVEDGGYEPSIAQDPEPEEAPVHPEEGESLEEDRVVPLAEDHEVAVVDGVQ